MVDVSHMNYLQAIILGIVQGLTEFLPVSSSAHLLIVGKLIGAGDWGSQFTAIIQLGTELALLIYWRKAIGRIISRWFLALVGKNGSDVAHRFGKGDPDALMGWLVIVGTLPIVLAGVLVQKYTDSLFRNLWITVAMLIVFGVILWLVDERFPREIDEEQMTWKDGLLIGLGQMLALVPGVSRSGSTLTVARLRGLTKSAAARFSFYLALPAVFGSGLLELVKAIKLSRTQTLVPGWGPTIVATVVAFVVGYLVFYFCWRLITEHSFKGFAFWRIGVAVVLALLLLTHVMPSVSAVATA